MPCRLRGYPGTRNRGKYRPFVLNVASVSIKNWLTNHCQSRLCSLEQITGIPQSFSAPRCCSPLLLLWYLHLTRTRKSSGSQQVSSILISTFDILPAIEYSYSTLLMRALAHLVLVSGLTAQRLALLLGLGRCPDECYQ